MSIVAAVVDQREPEHIRRLTFGCKSVAVTLLDAGDIWLTTDGGDLLIIERKTCDDYLSTLRDNRLYPQIEAMRHLTPWCYLAIVGVWYPGRDGKVLTDGRDTGWNWTSLAGSLLTCQETGCHIVNIQNDIGFEAAVMRLADRDRRPLRVSPARDIGLLSEAEIVLTSFPGIGPELAGRLLEACGSAAFALSALTSLGESHVPGIGPGLQGRARRVLGLAEDMELAPIVAEQGVKEAVA